MKTIHLKEVCTKITDGSHSSPIGIEDGYPMPSVKDMTDYGFDLTDCKHISKEDYDKLVRSGCRPEINDIAIAKDGSYLSRIFVVEDDVDLVILSSIGLLRPDMTKINPYFVKYYLSQQYVKDDVERKYVSGSVLPRIILEKFGEIEIPDYDKSTQDAIVNVLKPIDDKIRLNNSICTDLEAMAKQIYDYWFVQFDFPDENGKPYKSSGGKMVWNEELNREIPEGWEVKTVNSVIKQLSGYPFSSEDYVKEGKYKLYTIKNVQDGYIESKVDNCLNELPKRMDKGCLLSVGDMIMSLTGNVGRIGIVFEDNALLNQRVLKLIPVVSSKMYVRQFMMSDEMQYRISQIAVGTSQKNLSPVEFGELKVLYPFKNIMDLYKDKCDGMFDVVVSKLQENHQLTELRDFLLPMLMNGQIKIEE